MPDRGLDQQEVAALLKLVEKTGCVMAQGELPAFKVRGSWCTKRTELDGWIGAQPCGDGGGRGE